MLFWKGIALPYNHRNTIVTILKVAGYTFRVNSSLNPFALTVLVVLSALGLNKQRKHSFLEGIQINVTVFL